MQGLPAQTEAGDAATAAQLLLRVVSSSPPLALGIIPAAAPWDFQAARFWRSNSPFLRPSVAFFLTLEVALDVEALAWLPTPDARAARASAFSAPPPGGTNLGILGNGSPLEDLALPSKKERKWALAPEIRGD